MAFAATLHQETRSTERHAVHLDGTLRDPAWQPIDVSVRDLSVDGFRAVGPVALEVGASVSIGVPGLGVRRATVMRTETDAAGFRFDERLSQAELDTTVAAVVTAPILFPAGAREELLHEALTTDRRSRRFGAVVIVGSVVASWSLLVAVRMLLG